MYGAIMHWLLSLTHGPRGQESCSWGKLLQLEVLEENDAVNACVQPYITEINAIITGDFIEYSHHSLWQFKITSNILMFSRTRGSKTTLYTSRNQVPQKDLSIITASGQESWGTLCHAKDVLIMAIFLRRDKQWVSLTSGTWKMYYCQVKKWYAVQHTVIFSLVMTALLFCSYIKLNSVLGLFISRVL